MPAFGKIPRLNDRYGTVWLVLDPRPVRNPRKNGGYLRKFLAQPRHFCFYNARVSSESKQDFGLGACPALLGIGSLFLSGRGMRQCMQTTMGCKRHCGESDKPVPDFGGPTTAWRFQRGRRSGGTCPALPVRGSAGATWSTSQRVHVKEHAAPKIGSNMTLIRSSGA